MRGGGKLTCHDHVRGQRNSRAACARVLEQPARHIEHIHFAQRFAHLHAAGGQEGIGDAATDNEQVDLVEQRFQYAQLGRHLGTSDYRHQRPARIQQRTLKCIELGHQQGTGAGHGCKATDTVGAAFSTMRGAKGVHDIDITQRGHAARERLVIGLLARVIAHVFAQHRLAGLAVNAIEPVPDEWHRVAKQFRKPRGHRRQRKLRLEFAFPGSPEVREDQHPGAFLERHANGGQGGADARVAGHRAILHRHVQILADQHALALEIQIGHTQQRPG